MRAKGIPALFRGNGVACLRECPGAALTFLFYEKFKAFVIPANKNESDFHYRVVSGATAGIIANTITYPLDPIKTVMISDFESKYGNMIEVTKNIYK